MRPKGLTSGRTTFQGAGHYGAQQLELTKGKRAIVISSPALLPGAINTLIQATQAGELDAAIDAVVGARKLKLPKP